MRMRGAERDSRLLRLGTLINTRWLAVIGQSVAVLGVHYGLGLPVPLGPCFIAIALSAWLNVGLRIRYPLGMRLNATAAWAMLAYDIIQLSALLFLTGGIANPFSLFLIAPVLIAASSLPVRYTAVLGVLAAAAASLLWGWSAPLPWHPGQNPAINPMLMAGNWVAIVLALAFTGLYAQRVAHDARNLSRALVATELVLAREKHLSQLDGLAAAAAHELGTPLATIALVARELERAVPRDAPYADDIALMREQAARCRDILSKLRSLSSGDTGPLAALTLAELIDEITAPLKAFDIAIVIHCDGEGPMPRCQRNPGMLYGLANLVENAVDFARTQVTITGVWTASTVSLTIRDDGPGFAEDVLTRLGEPYVRARYDRRRTKGSDEGNEEGGGLGLGFFIAKTLLERTGAELTIANGPTADIGADLSVRWPRAIFAFGHDRQISGL